jgi:hypothetical protein
MRKSLDVLHGPFHERRRYAVGGQFGITNRRYK